MGNVTCVWQGNDWRIAATITALYVPVVVAALAPMRSWARAALTIGSAYGIGVALIAMGRNSFGAGPFFLAVMLASITLGHAVGVVMSVLSAAGLGAAYVVTDHQLVLQFPNDDLGLAAAARAWHTRPVPGARRGVEHTTMDGAAPGRARAA